MTSNKYFELIKLYNACSKKQINDKLKRAVKRHISETEYYKNWDGSINSLLCSILNIQSEMARTYLTAYDEKGSYKYKLSLIYLSRLAKALNVSLEFLISDSIDDTGTDSAHDYMDVYDRYSKTDKTVIADNIKVLKGVNGIKTNNDLAELLGISPNTVKANLSKGKAVEKNKFSIEQLFTIADAYEINVERLFEISQE